MPCLTCGTFSVRLQHWTTLLFPWIDDDYLMTFLWRELLEDFFCPTSTLGYFLFSLDRFDDYFYSAGEFNISQASSIRYCSLFIFPLCTLSFFYLSGVVNKE
ncbi:uncharacterized protein BDV17DRAFT_273108 [Aspergillus undulatus]|uniref:uncharacterized protein n=1 Tax=Aspergillus undulatus TaxID=1810928 RepID=UPI003CCD5D6A